jgi:hypothetical protein
MTPSPSSNLPTEADYNRHHQQHFQNQDGLRNEEWDDNFDSYSASSMTEVNDTLDRSTSSRGGTRRSRLVFAGLAS